jgi:hypothetical protein
VVYKGFNLSKPEIEMKGRGRKKKKNLKKNFFIYPLGQAINSPKIV